MPNKKLVVFITKRVLICYILVSIIDLVLMKNKWFVFAGLLAGTVLSVVKFGSYSWAFERIARIDSGNPPKSRAPGGSVFVFAVNQLILLLLLFIAWQINHWLFAGFVAGILTVPFVLMINSITELLGITKNHFE